MMLINIHLARCIGFYTTSHKSQVTCRIHVACYTEESHINKWIETNQLRETTNTTESRCTSLSYMTSGEKWTQSLMSPSRSELTSKSSSDDIVNVEVSNYPADHIFIWPFHNQIIRSIMSLQKFNRWEQRNFLRTDQSEREKILHKNTLLIEPHLVKLRAIRIDKDSLYVSTLFNAMFPLVERRSVRECQWVYQNEEKAQFPWSDLIIAFISFSL